MSGFALKLWDLLGREPQPLAPKKVKDPKQPYPYRFNFLFAGVFVVGVILLIGFGFRVAVSPGVVSKTITERVSLESVADLQRELGEPVSTGTGAQVAPQVAQGCPHVNIYEKPDGYILVCLP